MLRVWLFNRFSFGGPCSPAMSLIGRSRPQNKSERALAAAVGDHASYRTQLSGSKSADGRNCQTAADVKPSNRASARRNRREGKNHANECDSVKLSRFRDIPP